MVELNLIILIVWGELTFLLLGGLFLLAATGLARKLKDRKAARQLLQRVEEDRNRRLEQIRQTLTQYGLQGENLENRIEKIDRAERLLYKRIASMYMLRNAGRLTGFNVSFEQAVDPYYQLDLENIAPASTVDDADATEQQGIDNSELEQLRQQNQQLAGELSITMDTMGKMLNEYSSMFGEEGDEELDKSKIMEAFEVDENGREKVAAVETSLAAAGDDAGMVADMDDLEPESTVQDNSEDIAAAELPLADESTSEEHVDTDDFSIVEEDDGLIEIDDDDIGWQPETDKMEDEAASQAEDIDELIEIEEDLPAAEESAAMDEDIMVDFDDDVNDESMAASAASDELRTDNGNSMADDGEIEIEEESPLDDDIMVEFDEAADDTSVQPETDEHHTDNDNAVVDDGEVEIEEEPVPEDDVRTAAEMPSLDDDILVEFDEAVANDSVAAEADAEYDEIGKDFQQDLAELDALADDLVGLDADIMKEASDFAEELVDLGALEADDEGEVSEGKASAQNDYVEIEGMDELDVADLFNEEESKKKT